MSDNPNFFYGNIDNTNYQFTTPNITHTNSFNEYQYQDSVAQETYSNLGDFTAFYITIAICTVILGSIIIFNIICCCSQYKDYWLDKHTGNRWLVTIWSASPHKQPPLDLKELEGFEGPTTVVTHTHHKHTQPRDYLVLQKRESDL